MYAGSAPVTSSIPGGSSEHAFESILMVSASDHANDGKGKPVAACATTGGIVSPTAVTGLHDPKMYSSRGSGFWSSRLTYAAPILRHASMVA